jgi:hypothetical protein
MKKLIEAGGCDLGFATTFQDENIDQILEIFNLTQNLNIEMATSALHNAFQFHKNDNTLYNRIRIAKKIEELIIQMLKSKSPKNWFRAYLNLGLIRKVLGQPRLHPCTQGTDSVFIDPWGDVYACNVRNDLYMGNLREQTWEEIYNGELAKEIRKKVAVCPQNCWMVSSAKTAIRSHIHPKIPKIKVFYWVFINKLKVMLGLRVKFEKYINYNNVQKDESIIKREYYLEKSVKKVLQPSKSLKYTQLKEYFNK